jgi:hypothetical protein
MILLSDGLRFEILMPLSNCEISITELNFYHIKISAVCDDPRSVAWCRDSELFGWCHDIVAIVTLKWCHATGNPTGDVMNFKMLSAQYRWQLLLWGSLGIILAPPETTHYFGRERRRDLGQRIIGCFRCLCCGWRGFLGPGFVLCGFCRVRSQDYALLSPRGVGLLSGSEDDVMPLGGMLSCSGSGSEITVPD